MFRVILLLSLCSVSLAATVNNCYCGQNTVPPQDRVLGGNDVTSEEAPWYAGIIVKPPYPNRPIHTKIPMYAGVVVSDRHILTGAMVVDVFSRWQKIPQTDLTTKLEVVVGGNTEQTLVHHEIESITLHPNVVKDIGFGLYANDSAIIKLKNPLTFSTKVSPICLPSATYTIDDSANTIDAEIVGFGDTSTDANKKVFPSTLQKGRTTITLKADCENAIKTHGNVTDQAVFDSSLCTVKYSNSETGCVYDNGGAITVHKSQGYFVAGLVGWPFDCINTNRKGVHIRVSSVVDFINATIQKDGGKTCPVKSV